MPDALTNKSRRCYHRVMSGLERGGSLRFITLTSSPDAPADIQRSWRALYMRMQRRGLIKGYIKVPELTKAGRLHLHILYRGSYLSQRLLSVWWSQIHQSEVVDIRTWRPFRGKRPTASYMAKYMSKEGAGRYAWSWGWVWRGFAGHWSLWKRYWRSWFEVAGQTTFKNCVLGWQFILHGIYLIDWPSVRDDLPPSCCITLSQPLKSKSTPVKTLFGGMIPCTSAT